MSISLGNSEEILCTLLDCMLFLLTFSKKKSFFGQVLMTSKPAKQTKAKRERPQHHEAIKRGTTQKHVHLAFSMWPLVSWRYMETLFAIFMFPQRSCCWGSPWPTVSGRWDKQQYQDFYLGFMLRCICWCHCNLCWNISSSPALFSKKTCFQVVTSAEVAVCVEINVPIVIFPTIPRWSTAIGRGSSGWRRGRRSTNEFIGSLKRKTLILGVGKPGFV